jgi:ribose transport system ATP-binding protein
MLLRPFDDRLDVTAPVGRLTAAQQATVAIARALSGWDQPQKVLVLDEPTAALHGEEAAQLMRAVRRVAESGAAVIYISHRLDEVMHLADRIVALRDGKLVADVPAQEVDQADLVRMIAGREVEVASVRPGQTLGPPVLHVSDLSGPGVSNLDLDVRQGEIVGIAGLLGSGREEAAGLIFGRSLRTGGIVAVEGESVPAGRPDDAIRRGIALVPADRRRDGAALSMSARENLTLPNLRPLQRFAGWMDSRAERRDVDDWFQRLEVRPPDPERAFGLFSGGNQQKVVMAKWLRNGPRVLVLEEPTQGVDIAAKSAIYDLIASAASDGAAVIVSSSDTKELTLLCDRVVVMADGRRITEVARPELTDARLVAASLGLAGQTADSENGRFDQ